MKPTVFVKAQINASSHCSLLCRGGGGCCGCKCSLWCNVVNWWPVNRVKIHNKLKFIEHKGIEKKTKKKRNERESKHVENSRAASPQQT